MIGMCWLILFDVWMSCLLFIVICLIILVRFRLVSVVVVVIVWRFFCLRRLLVGWVWLWIIWMIWRWWSSRWWCVFIVGLRWCWWISWVFWLMWFFCSVWMRFGFSVCWFVSWNKKVVVSVVVWLRGKGMVD